MNWLEWLEYEVLGNSLLAWGAGVAVTVGVWVFLAVARKLVLSRLSSLAAGSDLTHLQIAAHTASRTKGWFLIVLALAVGSRFWELTPSVHTSLINVIKVALLLQIGLWITAGLGKSLRQRRERELAERPESVAAMDVLGFVLHVAVWTIVVLVILDNLGVQITAMIAGLGIGGVAVALALQNILGDLFASLSIVLDKPFVVGDFLAIDDLNGNVEKVGLKTTRIRSLSGEQLIFANNDLLNSRIRNYGRMFQRRVEFSIGVTYQTPAETLRRIPLIIREALEAQDKVRFDRAHFHKYGDYALIFSVVYYVTSADYNLYMDIQQAANLLIFERFGAECIEFAYPAQIVYLARTGSDRRLPDQD